MFAPSDRAASTLAIGAPSGMNTKHGRLRDRAAYATAWAWLPALPVTTPPAHASPSAPSFESAPRSLNEPVRWRFSALSPTVPPAETGSPGAFVPGGRAVSVRERHHRVDLDQRAARQSRDGDRDARRRVGFEERIGTLVNRGERRHVGQ